MTDRLLRLRAWPLSAVLAILTPGLVFTASPLRLSVRPLSKLLIVVGRLPRLHVQRLLRAGLRRSLRVIEVCRVRHLAGRVGCATSLQHAVGVVAPLRELRSMYGLGTNASVVEARCADHGAKFASPDFLAELDNDPRLPPPATSATQAAV